MPINSRKKGTRYELEIVNEASGRGLDARRAWGSDGRSMGLAANVDLVIEGHNFQAKRVEKFPKTFESIIGDLDSNAGVITRSDGRTRSYVVMELETVLHLIEGDQSKLLPALRHLHDLLSGVPTHYQRVNALRFLEKTLRKYET